MIATQPNQKPLTGQVGCGKTIERRTPTCRSDDQNGSNSGSNPRPQPSVFSPPRAAVYNTFNIQRHLISRPTLRRFRADAASAWAAAVA
jgi:hypothetical protein